MFEDTNDVFRSVNRRRTDNTLTKGQRTDRQIMIDKTLHRKPKMEQHEPN